MSDLKEKIVESIKKVYDPAASLRYPVCKAGDTNTVTVFGKTDPRLSLIHI